MPLTATGKKVLRQMQKKHGKKDGTSEFYATINAGKMHGMERGKALTWDDRKKGFSSN